MDNNFKHKNYVKTFEQFRKGTMEDIMITSQIDVSDKLDNFLESNGYYSQWNENDLQDRSEFLEELINRLNSDPFAIGLWLYQDSNIYPDMQLLMFLDSLK